MGNPLVDLAGVDDPEDPKIAEAVDTIIAGLEDLKEALGTEVAAMLYDALADRLDELCDATNAELEAELENEDDSLLADEDDDGEEPPDDLLIDRS